MAYIDDDELERLKKERPVTGNDTIDGYWLGYEAGKAAGAEAEKVQTEMYRRWYNDEQDKTKALEAERAALETKVAKLKKKLKKTGDKEGV